jgi:hypothetical protein
VIVVALTAAMLGCDQPVCDEVVAVGTYARWAAVIRTDGSVWGWRPGMDPTAPATMALEHAGATGFSNASLCLKVPGDVTCPVLNGLETYRRALDAPVQELSLWPGADDLSAEMCAVLWDGTLTCNIVEDVVGFGPVAEGIRHASLGASLCAITDQGKLSIPWQARHGEADWSVAAASLTDVVEAVALYSISQSGCFARTAGGQIWWIHEDDNRHPTEVVAEQVAGIDGPVSQLVTGVDARGDFVCALVTDGTVWCWTVGGGGGFVVPGDSPDPRVPQMLPGLPGAAAGLAGGTGYVCASLQDGTVWCRGIGLNDGARIRC